MKMETKQNLKQNSMKNYFILFFIIFSCSQNNDNQKFKVKNDTVVFMFDNNDIRYYAKYLLPNFDLITLVKSKDSVMEIDSFLSKKILIKTIIKGKKSNVAKYIIDTWKYRSYSQIFIDDGWAIHGKDTFYHHKNVSKQIIASYKYGWKTGLYKIFSIDGNLVQKVFFNRDTVVGLIDYKTGEKSGDTTVVDD